ncbi:MAG: hypothetical protein ABR94_07685 [Sphingobacteriales bacterium BACL12 MAG-120802-bin5]|jgi:hypothetical protein|nr:MAG: hypothetical protein ABR94_07685 [Sphingobacteriales bacterium BACL12 MAG-120802-bin5]
MKIDYIFYRSALLMILCTLLSYQQVHAQGCVGLRSITTNNSVQGSALLDKGDLQFGMGYRFFHSYKHFRGTEHEIIREDLGNNVLNEVNAFDLLITYGINKQWNITADLPYSFNWRSSLYEHGNYPDNDPDGTDIRRSTNTNGINDVRLTVNRWLFDTYREDAKGNMNIGFGIKAPTGDYAAMDTFYYKGSDGQNVYREVDQSIQLGDGGWGFSLEAQGFTAFSDALFGYFNVFYLFSPMDTNDAATYRSNPYEAFQSIPDQFLVRFGLTYVSPDLPGFAFNTGLRFEGIPVEDAIGESNGFRRPGKTVSVEPGVSYERNNHIFSLNVPIALYRNRPMSVADQQYNIEFAPEEPRHGDAAFADYLISFVYSYRLFNKKNHGMMEESLEDILN